MDRPGSPATGRRQAARPAGVTHLYQQLREEILEFDLRPGEELDEGALAERFGRSRTAVREALLNLSTERLVELRPDRGARVAQFDFLELPRFIEAMDLVSRAINRYAAERRSDDQLARIRAAHERFADRIREPEANALTADNRAFHLAVADAADNAYLRSVYHQLHDEGMRVLHLAFGRARSDDESRSRHLERVVADHRNLVDAIEARDPDAAEAVARSHTAIFRQRIAGYLSTTGREEVRVDRGDDFGAG